MQIASVGTAFPASQILPVTDRRSPHRPLGSAGWKSLASSSRFFANCGVDTRYLVYPLDVYPTLKGFGQTNTAWIDAAVTLAQTAIANALDPLGLTAADISAIFFASVTGIASPTIDARLINLHALPDQRQAHSDLRPRLRRWSGRHCPRLRLRKGLPRSDRPVALSRTLLPHLAG